MLPGVIGSLQAMEALKLLLNIGTPAIGKIVHYDAFSTSMRTFTLKPDPKCKLCGENPSITTIQPTTFSTPNKTVNPMKEITVQELKVMLDNGAVDFLLDVRMPAEYEAANIGGHLIPLPLLENSLQEIPRDKPIIIHCKAGVRSAKACFILMNHGFSDVTNVIGGTDAWRAEVDPTLPYT